MKFSLVCFLTVFLLPACQSSGPVASPVAGLTPEGQASSAYYSESHLDFSKWKRDATCCTAKGRQSAIASGGTHSSKAGKAVLEKGGNLVDASIATAFALAVERPFSCGIGGGGFFLFRNPKGSTYFYDFRETAPLKATRKMFQDATGNVIAGKSVEGGAAVATPGFVKGLYEIHKAHGSMPWARVLQPAIDLADRGFPIYLSFARNIDRSQKMLSADPYLAKLFQNEKGAWLQEGEPFVQKDLANTLRLIAKQGHKAFHTGTIAKAIVKAANARGGLLQLRDLQEYKMAKRRPILGSFRGFDVVTAPPPSAGGVLMLGMLATLSPLDLSSKVDLATHVDRMGKVMSAYFMERGIFGDSDFVGKEYQGLLKEDFAAKVRDSLSVAVAPKSKPLPPDDKGTAHLSAMDALGNAVASTITINGTFGSGVGVPGTGIILNNEMDDFSTKPGEPNSYGLIGSQANSIQPRKRPLSSMTPTILVKNNMPVLAVGGAGGSRILSSVFQVVFHNTVTYPLDVRRAVFAPRIHHQGKPEQIDLEGGFPSSLKAELEKKGHKVEPWAWLAQIEAVGKNGEGDFVAVFDPRDEGGAEAR